MQIKISDASTQPRRFRALFISDVHLGSKGCQAELLLNFLCHHSADTIYLIGDIIDGWRLKKNWYWPQKHNDVVQKFLQLGREGVRVIYLPGNHDEFLRTYIGTYFGGIIVRDSIIHQTADARRFLVIHGDQYDVVVRHHKWLAFLGDNAYVLTIRLNTLLNKLRRRLGFSYWSLSAWAKMKVKSAVNFVSKFEETLCSEARRHQVDGVICGHIHHATMHNQHGMEYVNTGDWVESCTAIGERGDGSFEIIRWTEIQVLPFDVQRDSYAKQSEKEASIA